MARGSATFDVDIFESVFYTIQVQADSVEEAHQFALRRESGASIGLTREIKHVEMVRGKLLNGNGNGNGQRALEPPDGGDEILCEVPGCDKAGKNWKSGQALAVHQSRAHGLRGSTRGGVPTSREPAPGTGLAVVLAIARAAGTVTVADVTAQGVKNAGMHLSALTKRGFLRNAGRGIYVASDGDGASPAPAPAPNGQHGGRRGPTEPGPNTHAGLVLAALRNHGGDMTNDELDAATPDVVTRGMVAVVAAGLVGRGFVKRSATGIYRATDQRGSTPFNIAPRGKRAGEPGEEPGETLADKVRGLLDTKKPMNVEDLVTLTNASPATLRSLLTRLVKQGDARRVAPGLFIR